MSTVNTSLRHGNTRRSNSSKARNHIKYLCAAIALACSTPLLAAPQAIDIPALPLSQALKALGEETGLQIVYGAALVSGKTSKPINGVLESGEALRQLLQGTGLTYTINDNAVTLIADDVVTLKSIRVSGTELGDTTEGTGRYTTGFTNTSTKLPLSLRETPQSVTVITRQRIDDQDIKDVADALQQTPGVYVEQTGSLNANGTTFYARGFAITNFQIDGVRRNSSITGSQAYLDNGGVDIYDRVEIVRGATGLMNGTGNPAATINLVRKKPTHERQGSIKLEAGSWDYYRAMFDASTPLNKDGSIRARTVIAHQDNNYFTDRHSEQQSVFYGILEFDISDATTATLGVDAQNYHGDALAQRGLQAFLSNSTRAPRWSRSTSTAADWSFTDRESQNYFASLGHQMSDDWRLNVSYEHTELDYDELTGYSATSPNAVTGATTLAAGSAKFYPEGDHFDIHAIGQFSLWGLTHDAIFGGTYAKSESDGRYSGYAYRTISNFFTWDGKAPARPDLEPESDYLWTVRDKAVYGTVRLRLLEDLSLITGGRVTDTERESNMRYFNPAIPSSTTTISESGEFTPFVGVVYDVSDHWSTYASYTDIFEPQSYMSPEGAFLDPLLGESYELGLKGEFFDQRLNVAAAVYQIKQDNYALLIPNVFTPTGAPAYEAVSGVESEGFEFELNGQITDRWEMSFAYSHNETNDRDGEVLTPYHPENQASLFTTYELSRIGNGLTVGGGFRWLDTISDQITWRPGAPVVEQGSYTVVDLMARYPITKKIKAGLNIHNEPPRVSRRPCGLSQAASGNCV